MPAHAALNSMGGPWLSLIRFLPYEMNESWKNDTDDFWLTDNRLVAQRVEGYGHRQRDRQQVRHLADR